jgi:ribosomal protein S18 acetylase RimI-like enzyme
MIRKANPNDIQLLHDIGIKTFSDTFEGTCTKQDMKYVLDHFFNYNQCKIELEDKTDHFFFYQEDDTVKGYMRINAKHKCPLAAFENRKTIELVRLYVLKPYHGLGVAQALMNHALNFAHEACYDYMYLSVWEYNFRARGFYEKNGFVNTGVKNDFPLGATPQTDYWFIRELNPAK